MVKVWKIAPGENARVWKETSEQGCITINWENSTDLSHLTKEALKKVVGAYNVKQVWSFVHEVQPGHMVVANKGESQVVGIGLVSTPYLAPDNGKNPRRTEEEHRHAHLVNWEIVLPVELPKRFFGRMPLTVKELISKDCREIKQAYLEKYKGDLELKAKLEKLFPPEDNGTHGPEPGVIMRQLLEQFHQIIAYGPPGTGKTREAKRVALAMLSPKDFDENSTDDEIEEKLKRYRNDKRFDLVVFHPAYEYEQFVGGIEPKESQGQVTFHTKPGVFLRLCRRAERNENESSVLIIDEINRGNLPKLLGELVYALEYRRHEVSLPFTCDGCDKLVVPKNLYVIGTMNSADRSIGHIDVAIRRRFALFPLGPSADVVRGVWGNIGDEGYGRDLAAPMEKLNATINKDNPGADSELGVGHSYFLPTLASGDDAEQQSVEDAKKQVERKWEYQVKPLLREYEQLLNRGTDLEKYFHSSLESHLPSS